MDKWEESVDRIKNGILAEEPEAAVAGALQLFADFGRTLEMISMDMDRIATTLERAFEPGVQQPEPQETTTETVHDL